MRSKSVSRQLVTRLAITAAFTGLLVSGCSQSVSAPGNLSSPDMVMGVGPNQNDLGSQVSPSLTSGLGNLPFFGFSNAPVLAINFSDFQCQFCRVLYEGAEKQIRDNYVLPGKVKFYYRDFPITEIHPNALVSAIAARCANDQGQFWPMHDQLLEKQDLWSGTGDPKPNFDSYISTLLLDVAKFDACYVAQNHVSEINADLAQGQSFGVMGTPGVFLIIPKFNMSERNLQAAKDFVSSQFGAGSFTYSENVDSYVVLVPGAYPYEAFNAFLSRVDF